MSGMRRTCSISPRANASTAITSAEIVVLMKAAPRMLVRFASCEFTGGWKAISAPTATVADTATRRSIAAGIARAGGFSCSERGLEQLQVLRGVDVHGRGEVITGDGGEADLAEHSGSAMIAAERKQLRPELPLDQRRVDRRPRIGCAHRRLISSGGDDAAHCLRAQQRLVAEDYHERVRVSVIDGMHACTHPRPLTLFPVRTAEDRCARELEPRLDHVRLRAEHEHPRLDPGVRQGDEWPFDERPALKQRQLLRRAEAQAAARRENQSGYWPRGPHRNPPANR